MIRIIRLSYDYDNDMYVVTDNDNSLEWCDAIEVITKLASTHDLAELAYVNYEDISSSDMEKFEILWNDNGTPHEILSSFDSLFQKYNGSLD